MPVSFRFWRSSLFDYFTYFFALSTLIALTTSAALYYSSSALLREEAEANSGNTLKLLQGGQELVLTEVNKAIEGIFLDNAFLQVPEYVSVRNIYGQMQLQQRLDQAVLSSSHIHSMYIYYEASTLALSTTQGIIGLDDFHDRSFALELVDRRPAKDYVRSRQYGSPDPSRPESVISVVKPLPVFYLDRPAAYVVINIKGDYVVNLMSSLNMNAASHLIVANREGQVISRKSSSGSAADELLASIPSSRMAGEGGSFTAAIGGEKSLVSYVTSSQSGWLYLYAIPEAAITGSVKSSGKAALTICLAMFGLSLIGSLLFSKRLYRPLRRTLSVLRGGEALEGVKEVRQLERDVRKLVDRNRDLTLLLDDYEAYSREKFLLRLTTGDEPIREATIERLRYYGSPVGESGRYVVGIVAIDEFAGYRGETDEAERIACLLSVSERLYREVFVEQDYRGYVVEIEAGVWAIALHFAADEPAEAVAGSVQAWFRRLHERLTADSGTARTYTIGVSSVRDGLTELGACYLEAEAALRHKLVLGFNNVIFYEHLPTDRRASPYPIALEKSILVAFKAGNRADTLEALQDFETYLLERVSGEPEHARHYYLQLYTSVIRCLSEVDSRLEALPAAERLKHAELLQLETVQLMMAYLRDILLQALDYLEDKRSRRNEELTGAIHRYIEEHLQEDLSLERLSDIFGISTSHLRRLFKEETGATIKEAVQQKRIAEAKRLLSDTPAKVGEIAERIGYLTLQSFSKAFKQEVGLTPGEYRESKRQRT